MLSYIKDPQVLDFLQVASKSIGIVLVTDINESTLIAWDIWITDKIDDSIPIKLLLEERVIPVIPAENPYSTAFKEFDPMKFEWNAFIFESINQFQMFEKLIRAIENMRYAGDKRTLLKNVESTQI